MAQYEVLVKYQLTSEKTVTISAASPQEAAEKAYMKYDSDEGLATLTDFSIVDDAKEIVTATCEDVSVSGNVPSDPCYPIRVTVNNERSYSIDEINKETKDAIHAFKNLNKSSDTETSTENSIDDIKPINF